MRKFYLVLVKKVWKRLKRIFFQFGSFETSPLLGAQLTVNQDLDNGVLQKATGEELYAYRPLVNPEAGATVKVTYTLTLQGSSAGSVPGRLTLIFNFCIKCFYL